MGRVLLDLSALIPLRSAKLLRKLTHDILAGRYAVAAYSLNRLRRNPVWRDWLKRYDAILRVRPATVEENTLFHRLLQEHGSPECNPMISDDDLMAIAIAKCRNWRLIMRDEAAEKVARELGVVVIRTNEFIRQLRM